MLTCKFKYPQRVIEKLTWKIHHFICLYFGSAPLWLTMNLPFKLTHEYQNRHDPKWEIATKFKKKNIPVFPTTRFCIADQIWWNIMKKAVRGQFTQTPSSCLKGFIVVWMWLRVNQGHWLILYMYMQFCWVRRFRETRNYIYFSQTQHWRPPRSVMAFYSSCHTLAAFSKCSLDIQKC